MTIAVAPLPRLAQRFMEEVQSVSGGIPTHACSLTDGLYSLLITFLRIALPCSPHIDDASVQMEV